MSSPIRPIHSIPQFGVMKEALEAHGITVDDKVIRMTGTALEINTLLIVNSAWQRIEEDGVQVALLLAAGEQFVIWDTFTVDADGITPVNDRSYARSIWSVSPFCERNAVSLKAVQDEFIWIWNDHQGSPNKEIWQYENILDDECSQGMEYNLPSWIRRGFEVIQPEYWSR